MFRFALVSRVTLPVAALLAAALPLAAQTAATAADTVAAGPIVMLVGDSTQTPNAGYGRGFCANLTGLTCLNHAKGGASTKTYRDEGLWAKALDAHPGYMLIQFGHNDEPSTEHLPRETDLKTEYPANLERFVDEARARGIHPILVTPLTRRYYQADGRIHSDLAAHAEAMRRVAARKHVPLIDLQAESIAYLDTLSEAEAGRLGITKKDPDGRTVPDKTHLNPLGSYVFGRMVAVDLGKTAPELARYVLPYPAVLPAEAIRTVDIYNNARFRVVLVGDSTVNAEGGWGAGFCPLLTPNVECVNEALNGRSSKSFYDEGAWKKALGDRPDYVLIQFGHNDQPGKGPQRETDPETTYAANLRRYITEARAVGARPILVTSLARRNYKDGKLDDTLEPYAQATRRVGQQESVPVLDLHAASMKLLATLTQGQADQYDALAHPDARAENKQKGPDRTHLNAAGQKLFGRMVADQLSWLCPEWGPNILGSPTIK